MIKENVHFSNGDIQDKHFEILNNECSYISIDTETTGLDAIKNLLSIIQIYDGKNFYIVRYEDSISEAHNIKRLLANKKITKIFHHAPFDLSFLCYHLKTNEVNNIVCTKIASKLLLGIDNNNSLKSLTKKYLGVDLDKSQKLSNWNQSILTEEQINYAINDVKYLYPLWNILKQDLAKEELLDIAKNCFQYLPTQALLSNKGIENIFSY